MEKKPVNWRDNITVDLEICHGRACITGTRVLVTTCPTTAIFLLTKSCFFIDCNLYYGVSMTC